MPENPRLTTAEGAPIADNQNSLTAEIATIGRSAIGAVRTPELVEVG